MGEVWGCGWHGTGESRSGMQRKDAEGWGRLWVSSGGGGGGCAQRVGPREGHGMWGGGVWQCSHGEVLGMQVAMTCCAGTRVVMVEPSVAMLGTLGSAVRVNGIPTGSEL